MWNFASQSFVIFSVTAVVVVSNVFSLSLDIFFGFIFGLMRIQTNANTHTHTECTQKIDNVTTHSHRKTVELAQIKIKSTKNGREGERNTHARERKPNVAGCTIAFKGNPRGKIHSYMTIWRFYMYLEMDRQFFSLLQKKFAFLRICMEMLEISTHFLVNCKEENHV